MRFLFVLFLCLDSFASSANEIATLVQRRQGVSRDELSELGVRDPDPRYLYLKAYILGGPSVQLNLNATYQVPARIFGAEKAVYFWIGPRVYRSRLFPGKKTLTVATGAGVRLFRIDKETYDIDIFTGINFEKFPGFAFPHVGYEVEVNLLLPVFGRTSSSELVVSAKLGRKVSFVQPAANIFASAPEFLVSVGWRKNLNSGGYSRYEGNLGDYFFLRDR